MKKSKQSWKQKYYDLKNEVQKLYNLYEKRSKEIVKVTRKFYNDK